MHIQEAKSLDIHLTSERWAKWHYSSQRPGLTRSPGHHWAPGVTLRKTVDKCRSSHGHHLGHLTGAGAEDTLGPRGEVAIILGADGLSHPGHLDTVNNTTHWPCVTLTSTYLRSGLTPPVSACWPHPRMVTTSLVSAWSGSGREIGDILLVN